jgi:hypothetical protein
MTAFTESIVEEAVLDWLRELEIKNQKGKSWRVSTFSGSAVGLCASRWTAWPAT